MSVSTKIINLTATIAITSVINTFVPTPAFSQSKSTPSSNQFVPTQEFGQPLVYGTVAAIGLTALGLTTTILSGKNKQEIEDQLKSAKEITAAVKTTKQNSFFVPNFREKNPEAGIREAAADLIQNYHTQALAQATAQFWFSITAASFGFLLILYTGFTSVRSREPQITLINALPGIAIEAVAALFFTQAEGTRKRATELYDRLRSDDRQTDAISLIESIENREIRDIVKAQWALQIVGLHSQPLDLSPYLPKPASPTDDINIYIDDERDQT